MKILNDAARKKQGKKTMSAEEFLGDQTTMRG
jgi:hypothetical protein